MGGARLPPPTPPGKGGDRRFAPFALPSLAFSVPDGGPGRVRLATGGTREYPLGRKPKRGLPPPVTPGRGKMPGSILPGED